MYEDIRAVQANIRWTRRMDKIQANRVRNAANLPLPGDGDVDMDHDEL